MSPFHPRLRKALLHDPVHRQAGLTADLLLEYEKLVTQLYYLVHYPAKDPPGKLKPEDLIAQIKEFRQQYMQNYDSVYEKWLAGQRKALRRNEFDLLAKGKAITDSFALLFRWLIAIFWKRTKRYDKTG